MLSTFDYSRTTKAATQPVGIKEEMIKKSAMAPIWQVGESARSVWSSWARQRGLRGHQGKESTQLLLSSIHPSSTVPSVCQDKQMRRHMLERLLENYWESFSSRTRWKQVCNPVVFMLLHTVKVSFFYIQFLSVNEPHKSTYYLKMCNGILQFWIRKDSLWKMHLNCTAKWNQSSLLYWTQTVLCLYTTICLAERKTN